MTIIILCVNWFKLVFIKLFRMTLSLNNVFFHKKRGDFCNETESTDGCFKGI